MKLSKSNLLITILVVVATITAGIAIFSEIYFKLTGPAPDRDYGVQIRQLATVFSLYHSETNAWPDEVLWKTQIKEHFPKLEEDYILYHPKYGVYIDFWGNEIQYRIDINENKTKRILYSFGRNKKDDGGKGDDIVQIVKQKI